VSIQPDTISYGAKSDTDFPGWLKDVNALAARSTPDALASILAVFYEREWAGKEKIVSIFREKTDALVYPVLEQALKDDENAALRNASMELYAGLGKRSLAPLTSLLRDDDEEVRTFATVILGNIKDRDGVPALIGALADPDLNVKHGAAESLGKIKDPRAVEPLIDVLHTDMWLQFPAAAALGDLGDARAVPALVGLLDMPGANVPAIQALGKIGDPAALDRLIPFLEDEESSLREWALEAVAGVLSRHPERGSSAAVSAKATGMLIDTLKSESLKARRNAAIALGCFRIANASSSLTELLRDREVREDALEAIIRIGGEGALNDLESYSRDSDPLVRRAAAAALSGIGTERSMKTILPLLADPAEDVRVEAALALARFNTDESREAIARMLSDTAGALYEAEKKALEAYGTATVGIKSPFAYDPAGILPLRDHISERLGLHYDDDRLNVLHHRLSPLAAASGFRSLGEYYNHIRKGQGNGEVLNKLVSQLTNNETYFFRENEQLKTFVEQLVPEAIERRLKGKQKKIRILSAGCSSGEEVYTIAMLIEEAGARARGCSVEVLGMDLDADALDRGRQARYAARSFRGVENGLVRKYFTQKGDSFVVDDTIRSMVDFRQGNVLDVDDAGRFDIIFCRNLLIYFTDQSVEKAAKNLHQLLMPSGYLLLGHSESLCRVQTEFSPVRLEGAVVYQRR